MIQTLIGTKIGMTHVYSDTGNRIPVTRLVVEPGTVTGLKSLKTDGYSAVQLASGRKKGLTAPLAGHLKKSGVDYRPRAIYEVKPPPDQVKVGGRITVSDVFLAGDVVKVAAATRGRGFAGVVKRWGFAGGPKTHGQSDRHRAPGSIGQGTDPGRVHKGKKMPGHYGNKTKTILNLRVMKVVPEQDELWISGSVPGHRRSPVKVTIAKPAVRNNPAKKESHKKIQAR